MAIHRCSILAVCYEDQEKVKYGYGYEYAKGIFKWLQDRGNGFEFNPVVIKRFRNGERRPQAELNLRKRNCYVVFNPNDNPSDWMVDILLANQAVAKSQPQEIIDVFTYMNFLRQDRKDKPRVSISARALARVVQLDANRVLTMDAHNTAIDGMYDITLDNLSPYKNLARYIHTQESERDVLGILENTIGFSPDKGGGERVEQCAEVLGFRETIVGDKRRKTAGEVDRLRIAEKVEGRNIFVIDDILDSGGTGQTSRESLVGLGAKKIFLYATHGLFTKGMAYATKGFDRVYIADTVQIPQNEPKPDNLRIVPYIDLFGEAIHRTAEGKSLSELFN